MKAWKRRNKQRSKVNPRRDIHLFTGDNCPLRPLKILENIFLFLHCGNNKGFILEGLNLQNQDRLNHSTAPRGCSSSKWGTNRWNSSPLQIMVWDWLLRSWWRQSKGNREHQCQCYEKNHKKLHFASLVDDDQLGESSFYTILLKSILDVFKIKLILSI